MKKFIRDFNKAVRDAAEDADVEDLREQLMKFGNVFNYAASCERGFEANIRSDYERKTTFTYDLSIGEWLEGIKGVVDTLISAASVWSEDYEYIAELILATNLKSWEHHARSNKGWSMFYAKVYYAMQDLYFAAFKNNQEASDYYFDNLD